MDEKTLTSEPSQATPNQSPTEANSSDGDKPFAPADNKDEGIMPKDQAEAVDDSVPEEPTENPDGKNSEEIGEPLSDKDLRPGGLNSGGQGGWGSGKKSDVDPLPQETYDKPATAATPEEEIVEHDGEKTPERIKEEHQLMTDLISEIGLGKNNECLYCRKHMTKLCHVEAGDCSFELSERAIKNKGELEL